MRNWRSSTGTSLLETVVALGVLSVGALGSAAIFTQGMERAKSSPGDLVATQKAQEAIESVFAARDSHTVTWAQLRNVSGASSDGGIFLDGAQGIKDPGVDGIVNTADDGALETSIYPGRDLVMGNADDKTVAMSEFTREIQIRDVAVDLRAITVKVVYRVGATFRNYVLVAYISDRA